MGCLANPKILTIVTSLCACASFAFLCIAVATDYWLHAMERVETNRTKPTEYESHSGLWRKCMFEGTGEKNCDYINYFTRLDRDENQLQTVTILLSVRRATLFPLVSLLILLVGEIIFFIGYCNQRSVLTFLAGILFVVGGLCTLIGIVTYISAITEEAGSKPKSTLDAPKFVYYYGASFYMTVSSFVSSELTGVLSVYLYIVQYKTAYRKRQEHLAMTDSSNNERRHSRGGGRSSSSRENSRDHSPSHASEPFYSYMPVSETTMRDYSNYVLHRDPSRHTLPPTTTTTAPAAAAAAVSVDAQVHMARDRSFHSVRAAPSMAVAVATGPASGVGGDADSFRRTTLV